jgi:hypothetical protein
VLDVLGRQPPQLSDPHVCLPSVHADRYGSKSVGVALALSVVLLVGLSTQLHVNLPAHVREPTLVSLTSCDAPLVARARVELDAAHRYREYLVDSRVHTPVKEWPRLDARIELVQTNIRVVRMQLATCLDGASHVL